MGYNAQKFFLSFSLLSHFLHVMPNRRDANVISLLCDRLLLTTCHTPSILPHQAKRFARIESKSEIRSTDKSLKIIPLKYSKCFHFWFVVTIVNYKWIWDDAKHFADKESRYSVINWMKCVILMICSAYGHNYNHLPQYSNIYFLIHLPFSMASLNFIGRCVFFSPFLLPTNHLKWFRIKHISTRHQMTPFKWV